MNPPFNVAIVGTTYGVNVLLPAFQAVADFTVAALCGRDLGKTAGAARRAGVRGVYSDWKPLLEDSKIDVVALALPPVIQSAAAVELAHAGKHLFCEKPLAATLSEALTVQAAAGRSGAKVVVDFGFRFVDAFLEFKKIIAGGSLGRPQSVHVEWLLSSRRDPSLTWNWKSSLSMGGGTLNLMGVHVLDYLAWFFGDIAHLKLQTAALVPHRPHPESGTLEPVTADDTCQLMLRFTSGFDGVVAVSTALAVGGNHRIRAWCERGLIELANRPGDDYYDGFRIAVTPTGNTDSNSVTGGHDDSVALDGRAATGRTRIAQRVVESFAAALTANVMPEPGIATALQVQRYLDLARASARDSSG